MSRYILIFALVFPLLASDPRPLNDKERLQVFDAIAHFQELVDKLNENQKKLEASPIYKEGSEIQKQIQKASKENSDLLDKLRKERNLGDDWGLSGTLQWQHVEKPAPVKK